MAKNIQHYNSFSLDHLLNLFIANSLFELAFLCPNVKYSRKHKINYIGIALLR